MYCSSLRRRAVKRPRAHAKSSGIAASQNSRSRRQVERLKDEARSSKRDLSAARSIKFNRVNKHCKLHQISMEERNGLSVPLLDFSSELVLVNRVNVARMYYQTYCNMISKYCIFSDFSEERRGTPVWRADRVIVRLKSNYRLNGF